MMILESSILRLGIFKYGYDRPKDAFNLFEQEPDEVFEAHARVV